MQVRLKQISIAIAIISAPLAYAQGVVLPPKPPAGVAAPAVIPPATTASLQAGESALKAPSTDTMLSVAIPSAPKAEATANADLKPDHGHSHKTVVNVKSTSAIKTPAKEINFKPEGKKSEAIDPYAGLVVTPVSNTQLNRFAFPEPVSGIYFPEGAPLPECPDGAGDQDPCKPVFLNGKKTMLLQLTAGAKGPIQMMVHLESGRFETLNLMASPGPGAVVRIDGAEDGPSDSRIAKSQQNNTAGANGMAASEQNVALLSRFARGDIPEGYEPVAFNRETIRFSLFDVNQVSSWDSGIGQKVHLFKISTDNKAEVLISPDLFRNESVRALALDSETIKAGQPAFLFMLENIPQED